MKKSLKIFLVIFITILCLLIILLATQHYLNNNLEYQMNKLRSGTTEQKIIAISYMGDHKILEAIPLLLNNINNENSYFWDKDPKGGRSSISCVSTFELQSLINKNLGSTCYWDIKTRDEENIIKKKWRDWYQNEYPSWLKEQEE
jgi:hypothetical protein